MKQEPQMKTSIRNVPFREQQIIAQESTKNVVSGFWQKK